MLATCQPSLFLGIDDFRLHELSELWGQPTEAVFEGRTHGELYRARFAETIASGSMRVIEGDSAGCLSRLEDNSLDIVYIDASHFYDDVCHDLAAAYSKMREDSWIVVNDYIMVAELAAIHSYGVVNATDEFMIEHGWGMQYLALQPQTFCDVALRPQRYLQGHDSARHASTAEIDQLRREVAILRNSTSWRVTKPMRAAARFANKLLG